MLRIGLVLFLICASAQAMAQNGRNLAASGCPSEEAETKVRDAEASNASPAKASAARTKYARPVAAPSGGGNDDVLPRARGSKWHSFLPGMFR
jgi:hypothetical protein